MEYKNSKLEMWENQCKNVKKSFFLKKKFVDTSKRRQTLDNQGENYKIFLKKDLIFTSTSDII